MEQLVATVVEVKALLADKEKTIAQNQAQIKVQNDSIVQLQTQISQFNHQKAVATHELTTVAESRLQQQTSKVRYSPVANARQTNFNYFIILV